MRGFIDLNITVAIKNQSQVLWIKAKNVVINWIQSYQQFTDHNQHFDFISSYQLRYIVEPTVDLSLSIFNGFPWLRFNFANQEM